MRQERTEGATTFVTDSDEHISKGMPVFYNPVMKRNRDLSLVVLLALAQELPRPLRIGLPMEASGVRAARILHELAGPGHVEIKLLALNDRSQLAVDMMKENIALNIGTVDPKLVNISQEDASLFLLTSPGFNYLDIDPFGTPNPFLDAAVQRIAADGILAVTSTDTSALAGTYPAATQRKYWAAPSRNWFMHEVGLRILARKVQLVAAQYDKPLVPVLSVASDHYYRIFFRCLRGNPAVKTLLRQHRFLHVCVNCMRTLVSSENIGACTACGIPFQVAGPLWSGPLQDTAFVTLCAQRLALLDKGTKKELEKLLQLLVEESRLESVGFVSLHALASRLGMAAPRTEKVLEALGAHGARTHLDGAGVKTDLSMQELIAVLQKLSH